MLIAIGMVGLTGDTRVAHWSLCTERHVEQYLAGNIAGLVTLLALCSFRRVSLSGSLAINSLETRGMKPLALAAVAALAWQLSL